MDSITVTEITRGFTEDSELRERYQEEGFGLETVFEKKELAEARASEIKNSYLLSNDDIRIVKHISSVEAGEKPHWEVYVTAGKGLEVSF